VRVVTPADVVAVHIAAVTVTAMTVTAMTVTAMTIAAAGVVVIGVRQKVAGALALTLGFGGSIVGHLVRLVGVALGQSRALIGLGLLASGAGQLLLRLALGGGRAFDGGGLLVTCTSELLVGGRALPGCRGLEALRLLRCSRASSRLRASSTRLCSSRFFFIFGISRAMMTSAMMTTTMAMMIGVSTFATSSVRSPGDVRRGRRDTFPLPGPHRALPAPSFGHACAAPLSDRPSAAEAVGCLPGERPQELSLPGTAESVCAPVYSPCAGSPAG
jgi:hypothetical protein